MLAISRSRFGWMPWVGLLAAFMLTAGPLVSRADVMLDFSEEHTLKGLFDGGLRPYREPGAERFRVAADNVRVGVRLPRSNMVSTREWDSVRFSVIRDGRLTSAEMQSVPLTLQEARSAVVPFIPFRDRVNTQRALDAFIDEVEDQPFLAVREFRISTGKKENPIFTVELVRTGLSERPVALRVSVEWLVEPASAARLFYENPIPAPQGHEGVSMEKPASPGASAGASR